MAKQMSRVVLQGDVRRAAAFARARVRAMGLDVESLTADDGAVCVFNAATIHAASAAGCITVLLNPGVLTPDRVPPGGDVLITTRDASRWGNDTLAWLHDAGFQLWCELPGGQFGPLPGHRPADPPRRRTDLFLLPPLPTGMDFLVVACPTPMALTLAVGRAPIRHSPAADTHVFRVDNLQAHAADTCLAAGLVLNAAAWDVGRLGQLCVCAHPSSADELRVWGVTGRHAWAARARPLCVLPKAHRPCARMYAMTDRGMVRDPDGEYTEME